MNHWDPLGVATRVASRAAAPFDRPFGFFWPKCGTHRRARPRAERPSRGGTADHQLAGVAVSNGCLVRPGPQHEERHAYRMRVSDDPALRAGSIAPRPTLSFVIVRPQAKHAAMSRWWRRVEVTLSVAHRNAVRRLPLNGEQSLPPAGWGGPAQGHDVGFASGEVAAMGGRESRMLAAVPPPPATIFSSANWRIVSNMKPGPPRDLSATSTTCSPCVEQIQRRTHHRKPVTAPALSRSNPPATNTAPAAVFLLRLIEQLVDTRHRVAQGVVAFHSARDPNQPP